MKRITVYFLVLSLSQFSQGDADKRLSPVVQPQNYHLSLNITLDESEDSSTDFSFDGKVSIDVTLNDTVSDSIWLHSKELIISEVFLDDQIVQRSNIRFDKDNDFIIIGFDEPLSPIQHSINISFSGKFSETSDGIYRTNYENNGANISGAATRVAPISARKIFPCFDEPQMRAKFDLTVEHSNKMTPFWNTIILSTSKVSDSRNLTTFITTKYNISPFLFSFALNDYEMTFIGSKLRRIYFSSNYKPFASQSLQTANDLENNITLFLNSNYEWPNLNHMGDKELSTKGESSIGLLHYNTKYLFFDPSIETSEKEVETVKVLAHKISNIWFGNYVTPLWWQYMWLSDGFGTFFEYFLLSNLNPDSVSMDLFVVNIQQEIMIQDALTSSHPVEMEVDDPNTWSSDDIISKKGGSILRMFQHILTPTVFQVGTKNYINEMSGHSAESEDLWRHFQNASGSLTLNYSAIGNSWIHQAGYPVVSVGIDSSKTIPTLVLNQTKFLAPDSDSLWNIPITFTTKSTAQFNDTSPKYWLDDPTLEIQLTEDVFSQGDWVIVNFQQTGFYRVNYDGDIWQSLTQYLRDVDHNKIPEATRAQLLDDAFTLAENGYIDLCIALDLSEFLEYETTITVWESVLRHFNLLEKHLSFSTVYDEWKTFVLQLTSNAYNSTFYSSNYQSNSMLTNLLTLKVGFLACIAGNLECKSVALEKYRNDLNPNYQSAIYCTAVKYGSIEEWEFFYGKYQNSSLSNQEKDRILLALGCTENATLISEYLRNLTSPSSPIANTKAAFKAVYDNNPTGLQTVLDFLSNNSNSLKSADLIAILNGLASRLVTENQQTEYKNLLSTLHRRAKNELKDAEREVDDNVKWHQEHIAALENWFQQLYPTEATIITTSSSLGTSTTEEVSTTSSVTDSTVMTTETESTSTESPTTTTHEETTGTSTTEGVSTTSSVTDSTAMTTESESTSTQSSTMTTEEITTPEISTPLPNGASRISKKCTLLIVVGIVTYSLIF